MTLPSKQAQVEPFRSNGSLGVRSSGRILRLLPYVPLLGLIVLFPARAIAGHPAPPRGPLEQFCAFSPDSTAAREDLFRANPNALRLAFAERLARCGTPRGVPPCLWDVARLDCTVNTDPIRDSLLIRDLRIVPKMTPKQRAQWILGVRAEQAALAIAPPNADQAAYFAAAADDFDRAQHLRRQAIVLGSLGRSLFQIQKYDDALAAYARALEARRRLGDQRLIELSLRSLGSTQLLRDHAEEAVTYYKQALEVGRARGDAKSVATTLQSLGDAYRRLNRFALARDCYEEALLSIPLFAPTDPMINRVCIGMAGAYRELGNLQQARRVVADEVDRLVAIHTLASSPVLAVTRGLYGDVLRRCGLLGQALEQLEDAVAALESAHAWSDLARAENCLGTVHNELGQHLVALQLFRSAKTHAEQSANRDDIGFACMNLGITFAYTVQPDSSSLYFQAALDIFRDGTDQSRMADALETWAEVLVANHHGSEAERVVRRAMIINEKSGDSLRLLENRLCLGNALGTAGRPGEGEREFRLAITMLGAPGLPSYLRFAAFLGLADNLERSGQLDSAAVYCEGAIAVLETVRGDLPMADAQRVSFQRSKSYAYEALLHVLATLDSQRPGQGYAERAFHVAELAKARALLDRIEHGRRDSDSSGRWSELTTPVSLIGLRDRVLAESKSVLLEYACSDTVAYLWIVTRSRVQLHRLSPPEEIAREVRQLRSALMEQNASFIDPSRRLCSTLLGPAAEQLRHSNVVYIVPDGDLFLVPFESLVNAGSHVNSSHVERAHRDPSRARGVQVGRPSEPAASPARPDGVTYELSHAQVAYAPSATVLALLDSVSAVSQSQSVSRTLLALGDPASLQPFPRLPFAAQEVEVIGRLFSADQRTVWTGPQALEDSLYAACSQGSYRLLHFATHGVIDSLLPERSHLLLATTTQSHCDGVLSVDEIEQLPLQADLAVLSACETGLGGVVRGEGVMGLARAFLFAGARSTVVSLWNVQDRSTSEFMSQFYRRLSRGDTSIGKALWEAKTEMRRTAEFAHPFFWSPFVLVGPGNVMIRSPGRSH